MNKFHGTGVAIITPFQPNGQVDYDALGNVINYLIDNGVNYIVSLGTTGESATLSSEERKQVFAYTAKAVNGRINLVAGIAGNNTAEVVELVKQFDTTGMMLSYLQARIIINPRRKVFTSIIKLLPKKRHCLLFYIMCQAVPAVR